MNSISVITLLAYDYEFMLLSLPKYINLVDEVIIGLDSESKTWAGNAFEIPDRFFQALKKLDPEGKIRIVKDKYFIRGMTPMELEVRERNMLASQVEGNGWLLSIDADELLLNATDLISFLRHSDIDDVCIYGLWIVLFKRENGTIFLINNSENSFESVPMATKSRDGFILGRRTSERVILSPAISLHYAWAREKKQIECKLENWGHKDDFEPDQILSIWEKLNKHNFAEFENFHPIHPESWSKLLAIDEQKLDQFAMEYSQDVYKKYAWNSLSYQNNYAQKDAEVSQLQAHICRQGDRILELKKEIANIRLGQ